MRDFNGQMINNKDKNEYAILAENLKKSFGKSVNRVQAVNNINLKIKKGEIFGLVGPDGAGKSTTIKMLCTAMLPDSGKVSILGLDLQTDFNKIRRKIGYLSQKFSLYGDLTVSENIDFFAEINGVKNFNKMKIDLLEFMRLNKFSKRMTEKLSGGMKQKLALACTLIHTPEVILLDEPTTGVDPVSRRDFWWILSKLQREGLTIIVSTPYLDEAERCNRVALMAEGKIIKCDTPKGLKASFNQNLIEIHTSSVQNTCKTLKTKLGVTNIQAFGDKIHILLNRLLELEKIEQQLKSNNIDFKSIKFVSPSLEDTYIHLLSEKR